MINPPPIATKCDKSVEPMLNLMLRNRRCRHINPNTLYPLRGYRSEKRKFLAFLFAGGGSLLTGSQTNKKKMRGFHLASCFQGWKMGFEPTTFGTTIRHSNQLSYIHHIIRFRIGDKSNTDFCYIQISKAVFRKISQKSVLCLPFFTIYPYADT